MALDLYRKKDFRKAKGMFEKVGDAPSTKFAERCEELLKEGTPEEWDGVYRFKVK